VVAYQHSPLGATFTNDASMLLPEHALPVDDEHQRGQHGRPPPREIEIVHPPAA
jgi:hypothetical protein